MDKVQPVQREKFTLDGTVFILILKNTTPMCEFLFDHLSMRQIGRRVLVYFLAASGFAATPAERKAIAAAHPSFAPIKDVPGLPRVLLIGDSISIGYTLPTRQRLIGVANVHRPPMN